MIAATHTPDEICRYVRADSLGYLSLQGMMKSVGKDVGYCAACFTENYPVSFPGEDRAQLHLFEKA